MKSLAGGTTYPLLRTGNVIFVTEQARKITLLPHLHEEDQKKITGGCSGKVDKLLQSHKEKATGLV